MLKHFQMTKDRVQRLTGELQARLYTERAPVSLQVYSAPDRVTFAEAAAGNYRPAHVDEVFGPAWSTHWFRVEYEIPTEWGGREVHLLWDSSSEACVFVDGVPRQGLTGSYPNGPANRREYVLARPAKGGESQTLYVEVACNHLFGFGMTEDVGAGTGTLRQAEIACFERRLWDLLWDYKTIADLAVELGEGTPRGGQALALANRLANLIDLDDPETWRTARAQAAEFLNQRTGDAAHEVSCIGHAHIDTAWLWPIAESVRKCTRTFASAVRWMDEYPEYKFGCSQAQQWEWMKERHPDLYLQMLRKCEAGQFLPVGGTWVEPDCNVPSGESLVRQFLFGQRFFERETGRRCKEFWNPDVFGYSGQLPQIMQGAGIGRFLTQKLSWNQFNKMPSHTFEWEGIDGSSVLTHFPPADTYNATASVREMLYQVRNYKDHERGRESFCLFGFGDGGGGPTWDMLERLRRMADVDGLPRIAIRSAEEFFDRLEADLEEPVRWVGELYFELHRGTYTTQARNKYFNRRCEVLLREVELLGGIAQALGRGSYPTGTLDRLWKIVLTNQFHDIIPGSSINQVYVDSLREYAEVVRQAGELADDAFSALLDEGEDKVVLNTLCWPRREVVELPSRTATAQKAHNGKALALVQAPPLGMAPLTAEEPRSPAGARVEDEQYVLENALVRATFRADGRLVSLFDKVRRREAIAPGAAANNLVLFEDRPLRWDAWDVDVYHLEKREDLPAAATARIVETGPLRAGLEFQYRLGGNNPLKQLVLLSADAPELSFHTELEWRETSKFLKVEFPLDIHSPKASYEVQFGHLERPTHFNTSWDMARFEVCAQRWAALAEHGFGVALLNNAKYGYAVHGNVMRLSLLRAPSQPDPEADRGTQSFSYALRPYNGCLDDGVVTAGLAFNVPLRVRRGSLAQAVSWFQVDHPGVIVDTVKKAEDSDDVVLRLYECLGGQARCRLTSSLPVTGGALCNLLEDELEAIDWADGTDLHLRPFQVQTVKLRVER